MKLQNPTRILFVTASNSGSTAIAKGVLQLEDQVELLSSTMKINPPRVFERVLSKYVSSWFEGKFPNTGYNRFYYKGSNKPFLFQKESIGGIGGTKSTVFYEMLPPVNYAYCDNFHIIFTIRDPLSVWNSWTKRGWNSSIDLLDNTYQRIYQLVSESINRDYSYLLFSFEKFLNQPEDYFKKICSQSGLKYDNSMILWDKKNIKWGWRMGGRLANANPKIDKVKGILKYVDTKLIIPETEIGEIKIRVDPIYQKLLKAENVVI